MKENIWTCKIGGNINEELRMGSDGPMRDAVERAFREVAGCEAKFTFSGWAGELTEGERAVVERRIPDLDKQLAAARAELDMYERAAASLASAGKSVP